MEQNDHPASARPKPRLTRAQYMRRKRLRRIYWARVRRGFGRADAG